MSKDLINRLRGVYAVGPTMENGEPEFGYRNMFGGGVTPPAIDLEAAERIEALEAPINTNDMFAVTLTAKGAEICNAYNRQMYPAEYRHADVAAGYVLETQLWNLMHVFGEHMFNGCQIPFAGNVIRRKTTN